MDSVVLLDQPGLPAARDYKVQLEQRAVLDWLALLGHQGSLDRQVPRAAQDLLEL